MMREQMRQDAIRTMHGGGGATQKGESRSAALHHSYAAELVPQSFTRNSKVYGKVALR